MLTIWKYVIQPNIIIKMPRQAQILHVHEQNGEVCMWAVVDPAAELWERRFTLAGTGHDMPLENVRYLGTAHLLQGSLVLHAFEYI